MADYDVRLLLMVVAVAIMWMYVWDQINDDGDDDE